MQARGKVRERSRQCQGMVKAMSRHGQVKVKAGSWRVQGKARWRGKVNNSNSFNEYQINFYQPQLTPYEKLQQQQHLQQLRQTSLNMIGF